MLVIHVLTTLLCASGEGLLVIHVLAVLLRASRRGYVANSCSGCVV